MALVSVSRGDSVALHSSQRPEDTDVVADAYVTLPSCDWSATRTHLGRVLVAFSACTCSSPVSGSFGCVRAQTPPWLLTAAAGARESVWYHGTSILTSVEWSMGDLVP